jgi:tetratricopeptide (TPR) repeat protein
MDRIATFQSFIQRAPGDPFPRYGLAMEHRTRGELNEAWGVFAELLDRFPDYVATYLMAGGTLVALGRRDEARDVYQRGIAVAGKAGDQHAARELESALGELSSAASESTESTESFERHT